MKATFTLHNLTESYLDFLSTLSAKEAFDHLRKDMYNGLGHAIKMKIGNGQFNQAVNFNSLAKNPKTVWVFKIEPRKGYKLATFIVE